MWQLLWWKAVWSCEWKLYRRMWGWGIRRKVWWRFINSLVTHLSTIHVIRCYMANPQNKNYIIHTVNQHLPNSLCMCSHSIQLKVSYLIIALLSIIYYNYLNRLFWLKIRCLISFCLVYCAMAVVTLNYVPIVISIIVFSRKMHSNSRPLNVISI